jgi:hypothetical protein
MMIPFGSGQGFKIHTPDEAFFSIHVHSNLDKQCRPINVNGCGWPQTGASLSGDIELSFDPAWGSALACPAQNKKNEQL